LRLILSFSGLTPIVSSFFSSPFLDSSLLLDPSLETSTFKKLVRFNRKVIYSEKDPALDELF
jgi:hypothetical protein